MSTLQAISDWMEKRIGGGEYGKRRSQLTDEMQSIDEVRPAGETPRRYLFDKGFFISDLFGSDEPLSESDSPFRGNREIVEENIPSEPIIPSKPHTPQMRPDIFNQQSRMFPMEDVAENVIEVKPGIYVRRDPVNSDLYVKSQNTNWVKLTPDSDNYKMFERLMRQKQIEEQMRLGTYQTGNVQ